MDPQLDCNIESECYLSFTSRSSDGHGFLWNSTLPYVEIQINNTAANTDDLVQLKCTTPARRHNVPCRIRAQWKDMVQPAYAYSTQVGGILDGSATAKDGKALADLISQSNPLISVSALRESLRLGSIAPQSARGLLQAIDHLYNVGVFRHSISLKC